LTRGGGSMHPDLIEIEAGWRCNTSSARKGKTKEGTEWRKQDQGKPNKHPSQRRSWDPEKKKGGLVDALVKRRP